jgi:hypothetical protein
VLSPGWINSLDAGLRGGRDCSCVLAGQSLLRDWRRKGARLDESLTFSQACTMPMAPSPGGRSLPE